MPLPGMCKFLVSSNNTDMNKLYVTKINKTKNNIVWHRYKMGWKLLVFCSRGEVWQKGVAFHRNICEIN